MSMMGAFGTGSLPDTNILDIPPYATGPGARVSGIPARATFRLGGDKRIYHGEDQSNDFVTIFTKWSDVAAWCGAGGTTSNYEARVTVDQGTLDSGSAGAGVWLGLGSNRDWKMADYTNDGAGIIGQITIEIRNASTLRPVKAFTVTFDCWRM